MQLMDWAWRCAAPARAFAHHAARRVAHHPAIGAFVRRAAHRVAPPHLSAAGAACRWVALAGALGGAAVAPFVGGGGGAEPAAAPGGVGGGAALGGAALGGGALGGGGAAAGPARPAFVGPDVLAGLPLVSGQGVAPGVAPTLQPTAADVPDSPAPSEAKQTLIPEAGMLGTFLAAALALAWHVRRGGARLRTARLRTARLRTARRAAPRQAPRR